MWISRFAASAALLGCVAGVIAPTARAAGAPDAAATAHLRLTGGGLSAQGPEPELAPAGDVNGDGLGDLLVGVPWADPLGRRDAGSAYVVFGRRTPARIDLGRLGAAGLHLAGRPARVPVELDRRGVTGEATGTAVASAGDVNGDGLADVAIGAPEASHDAGRLISGTVHVVFGRRAGGTIDLANLGAGGAHIDGPRAFDEFGDTLTGLTDALAIGASGRVQVVPHAALTPGGTTDLGAPAAPGHLITGYDEGDFNPFYAAAPNPRRLTTAPDLNGDGRAELLIGPGDEDVEGVSPDESPYETAGFAVLGGGPADLARLGPLGLRLDGAGSSTGEPLLSPGDAAGGRGADLLLRRVPRAAEEARWRGGATCVLLDPGAAQARATGPGRRLRCLSSRRAWGTLAVPGDVDGDRRGDVAVVAGSLREGDETRHVELYAMHPRVRRLARLGGTRNLGGALSGAGDVDGDGRGDLALTDRGEVLVVAARRLR